MGPNGFEEFHAKSVVLGLRPAPGKPRIACAHFGRAGTVQRCRHPQTRDGIKARYIARSPLRLVDLSRGAVGHQRAPFGDRRGVGQFQKQLLPIGIVVNMKGQRFIDEGADYRNHTMPSMAESEKQPMRAPCRSSTPSTIDMVRDEYRIKQVTKATRTRFRTGAEAEIDVEGLTRTVEEFNKACHRAIQSVGARRRRHTGHQSA